MTYEPPIWQPLMIIAVIFLIVLAILTFLMPFFVFRIRNEMIRLNAQVANMVTMLGGIKPAPVPTGDWLTCATCRKDFRESEMVEKDGRYFCASCSPGK